VGSTGPQPAKGCKRISGDRDHDRHLVEWAFLSLLWFKTKLSIVVLIFVNGFTMSRIQTLKLQAFLSEEEKSTECQPDIPRLKRNLQVFHLTQLSLFVLIIIVSVFRFG
jgi:hypothetical protein